MAKSKKKPNAASLAAQPTAKPVSRKTAASPNPPRVEPSPAPSDENAAWGENDHRFWWAASLILVVGILLRQWKLADAPFHTDEAIHAMYAFGLGSYNYDPVYHGPLLYHLVAAIFQGNIAGIGLGANDFTARLVPSLLGIGVLALVIGPARQFLGTRAVLWGAALLAISPVMVSYSRRLLHDSLVAVLTLGAVLCFQTAREHPSHTPAGRQARIGLAVLLTLFVATKANAFFIIAMLAAFWICTLLSGEAGPLSRLEDRRGPVWEQLPAWLPVVMLAFVSAVSIFALRDEGVKDRNETILKWASVFGCALVWEWLRRRPAQWQKQAPADDKLEAEATPRPAFDFATPLLAIGISALLFTFLFGHGIHGFAGQQPFGQSWSEAWGSPPIIGSETTPGALRRMWVYWSGQQANPRLPGRHDYYLVLMSLYELPILLAAMAGLVHASRKRTPFTDLLIWWAFTSWTVYAMANEKVPWLMTHMILPLALLAGIWLGSLQLRVSSARTALIVASLAGFIYLARGVSATNFERAADNHEPMFYAQTTEAFRDAMFAGLEQSAALKGDVWVHRNKQWPMAWYLRDSEKRLGFVTQWDVLPQPGRLLKMAVHLNTHDWNDKVGKGETTIDDYRDIRNSFASWNSTEADFFIWPRASWSALRPWTWGRWFTRREATLENGVLAEWSNSPAVVSVKR